MATAKGAWRPHDEAWRPPGSPLLYIRVYKRPHSWYSSGDPGGRHAPFAVAVLQTIFPPSPHLRMLRPAVHGILAAQHLFIELADAGLGDGLHELYAVGQPPLRYLRAQVLDDFILRNLPGVIRFHHHKGPWAFIPPGMRQADHAGVQPPGMTHDQIFQV